MNKQYPVEYITYYNNNNQLPDEVPVSLVNTIKLGFHILKLTPDTYNVPSDIKAYHAGFKHMRDITMPKIMEKLNTDPTLKGFFIAEGDVWIYNDFSFNKFIEMGLTEPTWIGYKKKQSNYIVGNFLLYFPRSSIIELNKRFINQKRLVYSDRFFTKLYYDGFIKLLPQSLTTEIEHYSNVINAIRKSNKKM